MRGGGWSWGSPAQVHAGNRGQRLEFHVHFVFGGFGGVFTKLSLVLGGGFFLERPLATTTIQLRGTPDVLAGLVTHLITCSSSLLGGCPPRETPERVQGIGGSRDNNRRDSSWGCQEYGRHLSNS